MVKNMNVYFSYKRDLLDAGDSSGGGYCFMDGKKKPGKIFISMSLSEGEYHTVAKTSNSSIH